MVKTSSAPLREFDSFSLSSRPPILSPLLPSSSVRDPATTTETPDWSTPSLPTTSPVDLAQASSSRAGPARTLFDDETESQPRQVSLRRVAFRSLLEPKADSTYCVPFPAWLVSRQAVVKKDSAANHMIKTRRSTRTARK